VEKEESEIWDPRLREESQESEMSEMSEGKARGVEGRKRREFTMRARHARLCFNKWMQAHRTSPHVITELPNICSRPNIFPTKLDYFILML
jgi:hypothetical protein